MAALHSPLASARPVLVLLISSFPFVAGVAFLRLFDSLQRFHRFIRQRKARLAWHGLCFMVTMLSVSQKALLAWPSCSLGRRRLVSRLLTNGPGGPLLDECLSEQSASDRRDGQERLHACAVLGLHFVPCWELPYGVRQLACPLGVFVRGSLGWLGKPRLGIVGARRATPECLRWVRGQAEEAAQQGWVVVSGGAVGIDAAAHEGAVRVGAPTVAVLGVSAGKVYPISQRKLLEDVLRCGGAIVWEHPPKARTYKSAQVSRNRLIAGFSSGLLVGEAGARSGSLHTAREMLKLGRPIVLTPQGVRGERGGFKYLRKKGARDLEGELGVVSAIVNRSEQV